MVPGNEKFPKITGRDLTHFFDLFWSKSTFYKKSTFRPPVIFKKVTGRKKGRPAVDQKVRRRKKVSSPPSFWPSPVGNVPETDPPGGSIFGRLGGRFLDPPFLSANFFEKMKSLCGTRKWKIPKNMRIKIDPFFWTFFAFFAFFKKNGHFGPPKVDWTPPSLSLKIWKTLFCSGNIFCFFI